MMPSNAETEADFSEFDAYEVTDMNQLRKRFHEMIAHSQEALDESVVENKYEPEQNAIQEYVRN